MKSFQIKTPQQWTEDEDGAAAAADEEVEEASGPNQRARRDRPWEKVSIFRKLYISLGRRKHASPGTHFNAAFASPNDSLGLVNIIRWGIGYTDQL